MITFIWDNLLIDPMMNLLLALEHTLFGSFGLAIIAFTIIVRAATFPLTMRQLRSTRAMSELQPKLQELQKKYKDPKRRNQETMKLYRESGVNPLGCIFPMLVQFPLWIALYSVVRRTLAGTPESYISLSDRLYPIAYVQQAVPINNSFLWLDLGSPNIPLALIVGASMWAQQRSMMLRNTGSAPQSAQQQQMNSTMLWMMPLMFAWISLTVPAGLALYWVSTNLIGIVLNGFVFGFAELHPMRMFSLPWAGPAAGVSPRATGGKGGPKQTNRTAIAEKAAEPRPSALAEQEEAASDAPERRGKRRNGRRGRRAGPPRPRS